MYTRLICHLLEHFLPAGMTPPNVGNAGAYMKALNAHAEIGELERIAKLDAPAIQSLESPQEPNPGPQGGQ